MADLTGTWSLESSENINEYLRTLGMSLAKRKTVVTQKPLLIIGKCGDMWSIQIDMKNKGTETLFEEGKEIDSSNELKFVFDNRFYFESRRFCRATFKFESPRKLVQKVKFTDTEELQIITKELSDDNTLIETLQMNDVKATRLFKRVQ